MRSNPTKIRIKIFSVLIGFSVVCFLLVIVLTGVSLAGTLDARDGCEEGGAACGDDGDCGVCLDRCLTDRAAYKTEGILGVVGGTAGLVFTSFLLGIVVHTASKIAETTMV